MKLHRLSLISIMACLIGIALLAGVTARSASKLAANQTAYASLTELGKRIDQFSSASDSLLLLGADSDLWRAYRSEAQQLIERLEQFGDAHPDANKAVLRIKRMEEAVAAALGSPESDSMTQLRDIELQPLDVGVKSRIILQAVASEGIALDAALDSAVTERQRIIARQTLWLGTALAGSALLFGALCVVAFGVIRRRIALPARGLVETLDRIRAGDVQARATVSGKDELSKLAHTLNTVLDERQVAESAVLERQQHLQQALAELETVRDRLLRAQEVGEIGSWDMDLAEQRLTWSEQVFVIFGIGRDDFEGTEDAFFERVHPDDREALRRQRAEWLQRGGDFDVSHRIVRPNGELRWVRERARVVFDADGQPTHTTGTVQDLTERWQHETRIRQLNQLIEGSEDLCAVADESGRYQWVNRAYAENIGRSKEDLAQHSIREILGDETVDQELIEHLDRCRAGEPQRFEIERNSPGRGIRRMLVRYYPIDVMGLSERHIGAVLTDITEIVSAQAELAHQAQLLDIAGRIARFGGWSVDLPRGIVEWSDITAEIHGRPHGYSPSVDEGIDYYAAEYRDRIRALFSACATHGQSYDEELQIIDAGGRRRWVRALGEPLRDPSGAIVKVSGALQDISQQKELEFANQRLAHRLASMLESITDGFVALDQNWRYVYVNEQAARLIGTSRSELLGTSLWSRFPGLAGTSSESALRRAMENRESGSAEEFFEPLGAWFDTRVYPWEQGVAVFFRDVSETHAMMERLNSQQIELRESRDRLDAALGTRQALINSLPAHIALLDSDGKIIDINEAWRHFGGQNNSNDPGFGIGMNYLAICEAATGQCSEGAGEAAAGLRQVLAGETEVFALEYPCHGPDQQRWFRVTFNRLAANPAVPGGTVAMHVDVTERKLAEQQLQKLAYEDPLTGLLSRSGFEQAVEASLQSAGWRPAGIIALLDLVSLRDINDAHGYEVGDQLLIEVGKRLQASVADEDVVGRTGADEFITFLDGTSAQAAQDQLSRLADLTATPFDVDGTAIEIGCRIGYTVLGDVPRRAEVLIREAEITLFEVQERVESQQSCLGFSNEMAQRSRQRMQMISELQHALQADEFELHLQPKVSLIDGTLLSAEALLRWRHPERGLQAPGLFIPIAEQSQLIGPIGDWVLREACRFLRQWQDAGLDIVCISVNVSLVQFMLGDFPNKVKAALSDFGIPASALSLEITESIFERHSDRLHAEMRRLHEMGVRLSLDDFGTGYSSLLYLENYRFDEVKIDHAFVGKLLENHYSREIVRSVITMAGALGADVVAEGIESVEIAKALVDMGCLTGQGFYFSKPLPAADFRRLLENQSRLPLRAD